jgi:hypothetical protein
MVNRCTFFVRLYLVLIVTWILGVICPIKIMIRLQYLNFNMMPKKHEEVEVENIVDLCRDIEQENLSF